MESDVGAESHLLIAPRAVKTGCSKTKLCFGGMMVAIVVGMIVVIIVTTRSKGGTHPDDGLFGGCSFVTDNADQPTNFPVEVNLVSWNLADWATNLSSGHVIEQSNYLHGLGVDFMAVQESIHTHVLNDNLTDYCFVGEGRDGHLCPCPSVVRLSSTAGQGERTAIFHKSDVWDVMSTETSYVSGLAEGWNYPRIFTIGHYRHKATLKQLRIVNVHLPTEDNWERQHIFISALLVKIPSLLPTLLIGDWNVSPEDADMRLGILRKGFPYVSDDICVNCSNNTFCHGYDRVFANINLTQAECRDDFPPHLSDHGAITATLFI